MKQNSIKSLSIFLVIVIFLNTGCATIFGHSNYSVAVNSDPVSNVTITNRAGIEIYKGATPATVSLKSSAGYFSRAIYQVKFQAAGYQDKTITVESHLNGWYIGNILIGGAIGMLIVDPLTGAMYKINDININTSLEKVATAQVSKLEVIDINSLPSASLKNLTRIN